MLAFLSEQARRFRRITTSGKYSPEVDGVRFLAISLVLFQHLHERLLRRLKDHYDLTNSGLHHIISNAGGPGVDIFFALSGYILYRQLSSSFLDRGEVDLKSYFLRRVTRLEPPYIVITTILCVALALGVSHGSGGHFGHFDIPLFPSYLATLTYTHRLIFGTVPVINPPGWSLEVEVQFYLVAPLLAYCTTRFVNPKRRLGVALLIMLLWVVLVIPNIGPWVSVHFRLGALPYFLVGIAVCEIMKCWNLAPLSRTGLLDLLGLSALALLLTWKSLGVDVHLEAACQFVLLLLVLMSILNGRWLRAAFSHPVIATIGGMCYSIYLIHLPVLEISCSKVPFFFLPRSYWILFAVYAALILPVTIGISFIYYALIERPCMRKTWPQDVWAWITTAFRRPDMTREASE